jgi:hypothetical protein
MTGNEGVLIRPYFTGTSGPLLPWSRAGQERLLKTHGNVSYLTIISFEG